jgi:hypothetical protein
VHRVILSRSAVCVLLVSLLACSPSSESASSASSADSADASSGNAVAGNAAAGNATDALDPGGLLRGVVREQIAVSPYVYLRLDTRRGETWAAVAEAPVSVGDSVTVFNAMAMEQFTSTTLQRTFDRIWFGALEPPANGVHSAPAPSMSSGAPPTVDARIAPITAATGADARTVDALWTEKEQLVGRTIRVRGVVVKLNGGVMGKNWIHLQDGSGDPALGTHDLTVTSTETAAVGDTLTVTGTVRINRDVGAGYTYALLLEDARLVRQ